MPIAVVQTSTEGRSAGVSSVNATFSSNPVVGNKIIAWVAMWNSGSAPTGTVTDSAGNAWTRRVQQSRGNATVEIWEALVTVTGGSFAVTCTASLGSSEINCIAVEYSGLGNYSTNATGGSVSNTINTTLTTGSIGKPYSLVATIISADSGSTDAGWLIPKGMTQLARQISSAAVLGYAAAYDRLFSGTWPSITLWQYNIQNNIAAASAVFVETAPASGAAGFSSAGSGLTISNNNLTLQHTGADGDANAILGSYQTTGKFYIEFTVENFNSSDFNSLQFGLATSGVANNVLLWNGGSNSVGTMTAGAGWSINFVTSGTTNSYSVTNRVDFAWDAGAGLIAMRVNGSSWYGATSAADPAAGTNMFSFAPGGSLAFRVGMFKQNQRVTAATASNSWAGTPPSGFGELPGTVLEQAWQPNAFLYFPQATGGGGVINVSLAETATAADTITVTMTIPVTLAETASALETISGALIMSVNMPETITANETVTAAVTMPVTVTETASALETITNIMTLVATMSETATAADTVTNNMVLVGTVTESSTASDTANGNLIIPVSVSESGSAVDTITGGLLLLASVAETLSASDSPACALSIFGVCSESGTASDTSTANLIMPVNVSETLTAAETILANIVMNLTISEAGSAVDLSSLQGTTYNVDVTEVTSAADLQSAALSIAVNIAESASALDTQTNTATLVAFVAESGNANDTSDASGGGGTTIYSVGGKYVTGRFLTITVYYPQIGVTKQTDD